MRNAFKLIVGLFVIIVGAVGCSSQALPLEAQFSQIAVGQTDATEVLAMLPERGMLHSAEAVSVYNKKGWSSELGMVKFNSTDSLVSRKIYVQTRSQVTVPPFTTEKLQVFVQSVIPDDLLNEPYENDLRKHQAILKYCRESLAGDLVPFQEDQAGVALAGLARTALKEADIYLADRPRDGHQVLTEEGFGFDHSVLGRSRLRLIQDSHNIFTVVVLCSDMVDPVSNW